MNDSRNHESSSLPLLYRPLCTRRSSYPKYIILINGGSPIPVRHGVLGHEISSALVNSGRAHEVPPVVDDIAFPDAVVYDTVTHYLGVRWGRRQIINVHFKVVIMDLYQKMHELFIVSIPIVFYVSAVFF